MSEEPEMKTSALYTCTETRDLCLVVLAKSVGPALRLPDKLPRNSPDNLENRQGFRSIRAR